MTKVTKEQYIAERPEVQARISEGWVVIPCVDGDDCECKTCVGWNTVPRMVYDELTAHHD